MKRSSTRIRDASDLMNLLDAMRELEVLWICLDSDTRTMTWKPVDRIFPLDLR